MINFLMIIYEKLELSVKFFALPVTDIFLEIIILHNLITYIIIGIFIMLLLLFIQIIRNFVLKGTKKK